MRDNFKIFRSHKGDFIFCTWLLVVEIFHFKLVILLWFSCRPRLEQFELIFRRTWIRFLFSLLTPSNPLYGQFLHFKIFLCIIGSCTTQQERRYDKKLGEKLKEANHVLNYLQNVLPFCKKKTKDKHYNKNSLG